MTPIELLVAVAEDKMKSDIITTVTGEIPSDQLGVTLAHEHLYFDISIYSGKKDNQLQDVDLVVDELKFFHDAGGESVVEVTPEGIGRDLSKLKVISEKSGVQIVGGVAFYDQSTYPEWTRAATVDQVADYFVRQIAEGCSGARAGLIGELMSHNEPQPDPAGYRLDELEARIFQAAAKAQRRTGVAISTHASLGRGGHAQLNLLEAAGANLEQVIIGHCDAHWHEDIEKDLAYYLPILKRGAYCAFDLIGWPDLAPDSIRAERIAALIRMGYENQLLLSTDTCRRSQMRRNGGRGFAYLWASFLPVLRGLGVTESQIHSMLVSAPQKAFSRKQVLL